MRRNDIPGQEELKSVLSRLVDTQKLPHAMLLHGVEGGVSLPLSLFIAQYLMCDDPSDGDACGVCASCTRVSQGLHPDVHYVVPVNSTKKVRKEHAVTEKFMDEWRKVMTERPFLSLRDWYGQIGIERSQGFIGESEGREFRQKLSLRAYEGKSRVFIIWHADRMNTTFANKVLKSLEEPSPGVHFILISEHPNKLLTTILSRTQRYREEHLSEEQVSGFLSDKRGVEPQKAKQIAFRAEGNMYKALEEAEQHENPWMEQFRSWMRMCYMQDMVGLFKWSEGMAKNNRDAQKQFVSEALFMLDRSFRMGWLDLPIPLEGEEADFYKRFAPYVNAANVKDLMNLLEEASFHIERNVNEKLVWYDSSIKAIRFVHAGKKLLQNA